MNFSTNPRELRNRLRYTLLSYMHKRWRSFR